MGAFSTILVGTDGSESSFRAVDRAAAIAADANATLVLVCAFRPMPERDRQKAADQLGDLAYKVAGSHPAEDILGDAEIRARKIGATSITPISAEGDPVDVIISVAATHKADLVVVGNRGLNSLAGRLLGSVPQNVSHRSSVDVLIVHTTGK